MNKPYKNPEGVIFTAEDLRTKIDWKKVREHGAVIKSLMDSLGFQAPEVITETYQTLITAVDGLAKELLLFDRTENLLLALVAINELLPNPVERTERDTAINDIIKKALLSGPDTKMKEAPPPDGLELINWLIAGGVDRKASITEIRDRTVTRTVVHLEVHLTPGGSISVNAMGGAEGRNINAAFQAAKAMLVRKVGG